MVAIGDQPILWHLLKYYEHFGFRQFVIALGHHADTIRAYFVERLRATPIGTGAHARAAGGWSRLDRRAGRYRTGHRDRRPDQAPGPYLDDAPFMLTWCDGLADIDLDKLRAFHQAHGRLATLTAVHPPARFGR